MADCDRCGLIEPTVQGSLDLAPVLVTGPAHRDEVRALYGERFCRMWEFYLAGCEMAFRNGRMMVFQIQLARERDAVPLTRDYVTDQEQRFEAISRVHGSASAYARQVHRGRFDHAIPP